MADFLQRWYERARERFYAHVSPEVRILACREQRLTAAEVPARLNSYEQRLLVPRLDDAALCQHVERCLHHVERPLGDFEIAATYQDAILRELAPLLVQRLREKLSVRTCRRCGCTDADCRQCIAKTGSPCFWVEADLCSACVP